MVSKKWTALLSVLSVRSVYAEANATQLYGTWSSKSNQVFTGPGFYDPVDELLIEPALPGISYSFTEDGWFEEATYQITSNPQKPECPEASLIFQHGTFELMDNGTLILTPITVDGRQLYSSPCDDDGVSTYTRYNQTETFKSFAMYLDSYHGIYRLDLYQFDGSPMQPLYLAYQPPMMLPTETLNPTETSSSETTGSSLKKRSLRDLVIRNLENKHKTNAVKTNPHKLFLSADTLWYASATMLGIGSIVFLAC
ncbi:hypothetical protein KAFR_0J02370 [Kazachstania africana CBS 2517]|uniref:Protein ROT1 n=1 Tax=Kazachstania africana (strain ATCC 22294 / BCRC 22015 / CBS 2517 / CECT 1963 / NBRC 1671 / NRRL Y-8276) TaxID=1071382 RepID=H2B101_KAZAF|nr:hypothetical protein KAFR_0J02370 [Kazachstania africana CBS 2517]CCF60301.1 hypothetical protein KAFR_0J02370 [Kazachstania africana CBS 2517]